MNSLKIKKQNGQLHIFITGDLEYQMLWLYESRLEIEIEPSMTVQMHLGNVDFIDSSGIGFLLRIKNMVECSGGTLIITAVSFRARRILNKLLLNRVFTFTEEARPSGECEGADEIFTIDMETVKKALRAEQYAAAALPSVA
jgi:anti-anti-sigma factor